MADFQHNKRVFFLDIKQFLYFQAAIDRVIFTSRTYLAGKFFHPRRPVSAVNSSIAIGLRPSVPKNLRRRSHADRSMRLQSA